MNFLGLGPGELLLIMVLALIVFGPGKLPEIGQGLGKAIREFRRATDSITQEFNRELSLDTLTQPQPSQPAATAPAAEEPHPVAVAVTEEPHAAPEPMVVEPQQAETAATAPARKRTRRVRTATADTETDGASAESGSSVKRIRKLRATARTEAPAEETTQPQRPESLEA